MLDFTLTPWSLFVSEANETISYADSRYLASTHFSSLQDFYFVLIVWSMKQVLNNGRKHGGWHEWQRYQNQDVSFYGLLDKQHQFFLTEIRYIDPFSLSY
jgi:hypothetical protein